MTDLKDLARRVSELQGPSREVDAAIQVAVFGDVPFGNVWPFTPESTPMLSEYVDSFRSTLDVDDAIPDDVLPRFTGSQDAAMTLARSDKEAFMMLSEAILKLEDAGWPHGEWVKHLPRFITAAALIARSEA